MGSSKEQQEQKRRRGRGRGGVLASFLQQRRSTSPFPSLRAKHNNEKRQRVISEDSTTLEDSTTSATASTDSGEIQKNEKDDKENDDIQALNDSFFHDAVNDDYSPTTRRESRKVIEKDDWTFSGSPSEELLVDGNSNAAAAATADSQKNQHESTQRRKQEITKRK